MKISFLSLRRSLKKKISNGMKKSWKHGKTCFVCLHIIFFMLQKYILLYFLYWRMTWQRIPHTHTLAVYKLLLTSYWLRKKFWHKRNQKFYSLSLSRHVLLDEEKSCKNSIRQICVTLKLTILTSPHSTDSLFPCVLFIHIQHDDEEKWSLPVDIVECKIIGK
jgi:hypothetical protein